MPERVFQWEAVRAYWRLPARERLWHAAVVATLLLTHAGAKGLLGWYNEHHRSTFITRARRALSDRTRVLFLGNSHFYLGIRPDRFPFEAMTIAGSGFNYQIMEAALRKHLDRLGGLDVAVIAFDANPLMNASAMGGVGGSPELAEWGIAPWELPGTTPSRSLDAAIRRYAVPVNRLTPDSLLTAVGLKPDPVVAGHVPCDVRYEGKPGQGGRAAHHAALFRDAQFEPNCASLLRIVRLLDDRGVRVVLLRTPFHPSYASVRLPSWERRCEDALARVRSESGPRRPVVVWDYMRHPDFGDDHFRDDDHLNSHGADRLCGLLRGPIAGLLAEPDDRPTRIASGNEGGRLGR